MAKKLTEKEVHRARICFECGCLPSRKFWSDMINDKGEQYDAVMYFAKQFPVSEDEIITIEELQSREEIHAVADNYHWDDNTLDSLYAFINHPLCDAGTALLLFWKGAGYRILSHNSCPSDDKEEKLFFSELILRFKAKGFNSYDIAFNPYSDHYIPPLDECLKKGYLIPGEFLCPYSTMYVDTNL
ncbi:DUF4274 domain-containing protein [Microbulbifer sp. OS29]|uniref:DUF4274 domain-containing protein n=1 Tax=Microbulbifer okhotskensis TaxID=2926617 RepID=A0A9X2EIR2_9GAMM|nr:DUF4274 domain-containing protein [Microbulbifer okhotskensis]MCO1333004.1 DUF4274 domain-containing protein [Microbulbifer okhotskensis]